MNSRLPRLDAVLSRARPPFARAALRARLPVLFGADRRAFAMIVVARAWVHLAMWMAAGLGRQVWLVFPAPPLAPPPTVSALACGIGIVLSVLGVASVMFDARTLPDLARFVAPQARVRPAEPTTFGARVRSLFVVRAARGLAFFVLPVVVCSPFAWLAHRFPSRLADALLLASYGLAFAYVEARTWRAPLVAAIAGDSAGRALREAWNTSRETAAADTAWFVGLLALEVVGALGIAFIGATVLVTLPLAEAVVLSVTLTRFAADALPTAERGPAIHSP